jgi:hypothetical protein
VKSDAPQGAQVLQRRRDIQRQQQINGGIEIEARNWFGRSPSRAPRKHV